MTFTGKFQNYWWNKSTEKCEHMQNYFDTADYADIFVRRMEYERARMGFTQNQMAEQMGMSASGYKKIISGETRKIDLQMVHRLSSLTNMYMFDLLEQDNSVIRLARKMNNLSENQMKMVELFVDFESQFVYEERKPEKSFITVLESTADVRDGMFWDSMIMYKVEAGEYQRRYGGKISCGIRVNSNYMVPAYVKGDILLICKEPIQDGDVGVFVDKRNGQAYVRKYRRATPSRLEPVADYGENYYIDEENPGDVMNWVKFGKVISKIRQ